jgi:hypothetical protein
VDKLFTSQYLITSGFCQSIKSLENVRNTPLINFITHTKASKRNEESDVNGSIHICEQLRQNAALSIDKSVNKVNGIVYKS